MIGGCPDVTVYSYETIEEGRRLLAQHLSHSEIREPMFAKTILEFRK